MDPAVAALIGAGVAAVVGLGVQFLAHWLGKKRDRLNATRLRHREVIEHASLALYPQNTKEEAFGTAERPETGEGRWHLDFLADVWDAQAATMHAHVLLKFHLGDEHELTKEYFPVSVMVVRSVRYRAQDQRGEYKDLTKEAAQKIIGDGLVEMNHARNAWLAKAKAYAAAL